MTVRPTISSNMVLETIRQHPGLTTRELCSLLPRRYESPSVQARDLAVRMTRLKQSGQIRATSTRPMRWVAE